MKAIAAPPAPAPMQQPPPRMQSWNGQPPPPIPGPPIPGPPLPPGGGGFVSFDIFFLNIGLQIQNKSRFLFIFTSLSLIVIHFVFFRQCHRRPFDHLCGINHKFQALICHLFQVAEILSFHRLRPELP